jgi:hydroxypyruvate isomerase
MLKLAANVSTLFTEWPLLERPAAAAAAGFRAIEVQSPYAVSADAFAVACEAAGVACVLLNIPSGEVAAGELGLAGLPGREAAFAAALETALAYAGRLRCARVNCLAGIRPADESRERCVRQLLANLRRAAARSAAVGVELLVEPLNPVDQPEFLLTRIADADALLEAVDHPNLRLQYDTYHRAAAGEAWAAGLEARLSRVGHIQFSDYPGRHEPGTGELDLTGFLRRVDALPYTGYVGCEYRPSASTAASFAWRAELADLAAVAGAVEVGAP